MPKNKNVLVDYTSRDFESIKKDLVEFAKRYYPDNYKDFSDASFGSLDRRYSIILFRLQC